MVPPHVALLDLKRTYKKKLNLNMMKDMYMGTFIIFVEIVSTPSLLSNSQLERK